MEDEIVQKSFDGLVRSIQQIHDELAAQASRAVNVSLTLRNWLIGRYIVEYELKGEDRAQYGEALLENLSSELKRLSVSACGRRELYRYVRFYQTYPRIVGSLTPQFQHIVPKQFIQGLGGVALEENSSQIEPKEIVERLSYTHIEQLVGIENDTKRAFVIN